MWETMRVQNLILCANGLSGIKEAITAAFPKTEYQRCIVHQVRNTLKYVPDKDRKAFAVDLKNIYHATTEEKTREALFWGYQEMDYDHKKLGSGLRRTVYHV